MPGHVQNACERYCISIYLDITWPLSNKPYIWYVSGLKFDDDKAIFDKTKEGMD